jgi:hypothetical protein
MLHGDSLMLASQTSLMAHFDDSLRAEKGYPKGNEV